MQVSWVHNDHTTGAHDGAGLGQRFIVHREVQLFRREAAAGRTAGLDRLEFLVIRYTAADIVDDLAEGQAHRYFDKTGAVDLPGQREGLGTLAFLGTVPGVPVTIVLHDGRDIGPGSRRC